MNVLNVKLDITLLTETFITLFTFIIIPMSVMNSFYMFLKGLFVGEKFNALIIFKFP